jgi:hypothetical protein
MSMTSRRALMGLTLSLAITAPAFAELAMVPEVSFSSVGTPVALSLATFAWLLNRRPSSR